MAVSIADLVVTVSSDVSNALNGLNRVNGELSRSKTAFEAARPAALAFTAAGAAVGLGLGRAVSVAADFEQEMSNVRAVMSPAEARQFGSALADLALTLGADTSFSAREAAQGIEELIKAGVPAQAVLEGAGKAALDLAAATGITVADAAEVASQGMNAFHLSVAQLPGAVDQLAGVVNVSAAGMSDLRFGLQAVGPVAAGLGISFNDTTAALGLFANAGLRGQDAGTSLKTFLLGLQPSTKQQTTLFKQLGLITASGSNAFFDAAGNAKDLASIAGVLRNALSGMTKQQRLATLETLFGTDAIRAANILYEDGAQGVRAFQGEVGKIRAADVAAERLNNLAGDLEQLRGAFETAQISIGRQFTPALRQVVQHATEAVRAFNKLSPELKRNITFAVALGGGIAFLLGSFVLLAPFIATAPAAFGAMATALGILAPIFGVVALATAALVVAWRRDLGGIQEIVRGAFERLPSTIDATNAKVNELQGAFDVGLIIALENARAFIDTRLTPALSDLRDRLDEVGQKLEPLSGKLDTAAGFAGILAAQLGLISISGSGAGGGLGTFSAGIGDISLNLGLLGPALTAVGLALRILPLLFAALGGPITVAVVAIGAIALGFKLAYDNIQPFREAVDALIANLPSLGEQLTQAFQPLADFVTTNGPGVLDFLQNLGQGAFSELLRQGESIRPFTDAVGNFFNAVVNLGGALADFAGPALVTFFTDTLPTAFGNLRAALEPLQPLLGPIGDFLRTLTIGDLLAPMVANINLFADGINKLAEAMRNLPELNPELLRQLFGVIAPGSQFLSLPKPPGAAAATPTAFAFGGGAGAGGAVVQIGQIVVTNEADEDRLVAKIGALLADSANRVNVPPDNSGNPALQPTFS